jgi:hypothetical protein
MFFVFSLVLLWEEIIDRCKGIIIHVEELSLMVGAMKKIVSLRVDRYNIVHII